MKKYVISDNFEIPQLMRYFEDISAIPRGTFNENAIADYLVAFAKERGLEYYRDEYNNVLIKKAATPDSVDREALLLQGHTDMVCVKREGSAHDFTKDPLDLYEEDGWIKAKDTSLGADDGVAVAVMLNVLDGGVESHPYLECLFTASEEIGLTGASNFDYSHITAKRLINLDGGNEKVIISGCAGGMLATVDYSAALEDTDNATYSIKIGGLIGGHSGGDISKSRVNSNKLMGRVLSCLRKYGIRIASINGGSKPNAIPRDCEAVITAESDVSGEISKLSKIISAELSVSERQGFYLECAPTAAAARAMTKEATDKLIFFLAGVPNGVIRQNTAVKGVVDQSVNMGTIETAVKNDNTEVKIVFNMRSSIDTLIDETAGMLTLWAENIGASISLSSRYPAWQYAENSKLREDYIKSYKELGEDAPKVIIIHAGLECGIITKALPMDAICCGSLVEYMHSPDERMNKAALAKFYKIVKNFIEKY